MFVKDNLPSNAVRNTEVVHSSETSATQVLRNISRRRPYRSFATRVSQLKICDFFQEKLSKVLKCYNFLWVQRRHNCSPAASFTNCVMTLYRLKVHLQTFLSVPITQKYQILSFDTLVANERNVPPKRQLHRSPYYTLKKDTVYSSENFATTYQTTLCYNSDGRNMNRHCLDVSRLTHTVHDINAQLAASLFDCCEGQLCWRSQVLILFRLAEYLYVVVLPAQRKFVTL